MKLYHSSNISVENPDTVHSRDYLDFGKGFYLTSLHDQAVKYAQRFLRRQQNAWLNIYDFVYNPSEWNVRQFPTYDKECLDFVSKCRAGIDNTNYDIVIGGIVMTRLSRLLTAILMANYQKTKHSAY